MAHVLPLGIVLVPINATVVGQPHLIRVGVGHQGVLVHVQVAVLHVNPRRTGIVRTLHSDAACVHPVDHQRIGFERQVVPGLTAVGIT